MDEIQFTSSENVPLPPEEVKILNFQAEPYPDGRRVKMILTFTPFQSYPSAEIVIKDPSGEPAASLHIIETIDIETEITLHLPGEPEPGPYSAELKAFYLEEKTSEREPDQIMGLKQNLIGKTTAQFVIS